MHMVTELPTIRHITQGRDRIVSHASVFLRETKWNRPNTSWENMPQFIPYFQKVQPRRTACFPRVVGAGYIRASSRRLGRLVDRI